MQAYSNGKGNMIIDKLAESRIVHIIVRLGISICIGCFLIQTYMLGEEITISKMNSFMEGYKDFYEFVPDDDLWKDNSELYSILLEEWAMEENTRILPLGIETVCWDDSMRVVTYENPSFFDAKWDMLSLPLKDGRWFKGDANEVICINADFYEPGDKIEIADKNGHIFNARVVGVAEYPFLPNSNGVKKGADDCTSDFSDMKNVFLLNPRSVFNERADILKNSVVFVKTDNAVLISKMNGYGTCEKVDGLLLENKPGITKVISIMVVSMLGLILLCVLGRILFGLPGIGWCAFFAGYFTFGLKYDTYLEGIGELIITIVVCSVIGFGYWGIITLMEKWNSKHKDYEVVLIDTESCDI